MATSHRRELKSGVLLLLATYVFIGASIALFSLRYGEHVGGPRSISFVFFVDNPKTLNNVFTVIGVFHAGFAFAMTKLATRIESQIRTRMAVKGIELNDLLNTLPDSPASIQVWLRGLGLYLTLASVFTTTYSVAGGILYKQGLALSTTPTPFIAQYPIEYISTCKFDMKCDVNRIILYGTAMGHILNGSAYSKGVERINNNHRRVAIASIPSIPVRQETGKISGDVFGVVFDYQNADQSVQFARIPYNDETNTIPIQLGVANVTDHRWMIQSNNMTVIGDAKWCKLSCHWRIDGPRLELVEYKFDISQCSPKTYLEIDTGYYAIEFLRTIVIDYLDRLEARNNIQPTPQLLDASYVFAALYSVQTLGPYSAHKELFDALRGDARVADIAFKDSLTFHGVLNRRVIQSNIFAAVYVIMLFVAVLVIVYCGFVDKYVWVTVWAPIYMTLVDQEEMEVIGKEISGGLKPVDEKHNEVVTLIE
ncbi:hypothetical protein BDD12DRAFT_936367 [Trichophaea hybrida]|nr:hypothetical protein BDD12DRAFT_936367 [Trichophaea hybrida]